MTTEYFDQKELLTIYEITHTVLSDDATIYATAGKLELSVDYLSELRDKIQRVTDVLSP